MTAPQVRTPGGNPANAENKTTDTEHSASTAADMQADTATVIARALMAGVAVHELPTGSFIATRPGLVVPLPDLAAVQALVCRIGGAA